VKGPMVYIGGGRRLVGGKTLGEATTGGKGGALGHKKISVKSWAAGWGYKGSVVVHCGSRALEGPNDFIGDKIRNLEVSCFSGKGGTGNSIDYNGKITTQGEGGRR